MSFRDPQSAYEYASERQYNAALEAQHAADLRAEWIDARASELRDEWLQSRPKLIELISEFQCHGTTYLDHDMDAVLLDAVLGKPEVYRGLFDDFIFREAKLAADGEMLRREEAE